MGFMIQMMFLLVGIMISIPFFTLFERKMLGLMQKRKGPNKMSMIGILQPMFDGMKLMIKESSFLFFSKYLIFSICSFFSFIMMLFLWLCSMFFKNFFLVNYKVIILLMLSSLNVYFLMGSGWSSKSKYSLLGSVRGAAQLISYEISLLFMVLIPLIIKLTLKLWNFYYKSKLIFLFLLILIFGWMVMILAETKRAPFDFAEGESELVSGFNIEYGSLVFAFMFLGEYGSILWMSFFSSLIFFFLKYNFFFFFLVFSVVWFRGTFPRLRYDLLMSLAWKVILPGSLFFFFCVVLFF